MRLPTRARPSSRPPAHSPAMWMSWKTIIKARTRGAPAQSDSAMSTTTAASALPPSKEAAADTAAPALSVFEGDALSSVTEKYKLGHVCGKGEGGQICTLTMAPRVKQGSGGRPTTARRPVAAPAFGMRHSWVQA